MSTLDNRRFTQIGIDRLVRLQWLERTAYLVLAGNEPPVIKKILQDDLRESFRSGNTKVRGSLSKTITILMKVWVEPPRDLRELQVDGLKLLASTSRDKHVAIHWGMVMAAYPFWGAVAACVGRLLKLQGTVAAAQVQRRIREQYGERETVSRRVRYVLRSFVDWGVLKETSKAGTYTTTGLPTFIDQPELIAWLLEAFLRAQGQGAMDYEALYGSPSFFPFHLQRLPADRLAAESGRLYSLRHGLNHELIILRELREAGSSRARL